ncbi:uncharacterized protein LOC116612243 [Nematostella vectensis]|uniref:uncharacterized protein LOC116612243 n=1 Tax=Nematostella vectensis TaxID=45351 RepID=UPI0013903938|nr:uncharacterized protein LOC116612243 [Nematostella vectensis]
MTEDFPSASLFLAECLLAELTQAVVQESQELQALELQLSEKENLQSSSSLSFSKQDQNILLHDLNESFKIKGPYQMFNRSNMNNNYLHSTMINTLLENKDFSKVHSAQATGRYPRSLSDSEILKSLHSEFSNESFSSLVEKNKGGEIMGGGAGKPSSLQKGAEQGESERGVEGEFGMMTNPCADITPPSVDFSYTDITPPSVKVDFLDIKDFYEKAQSRVNRQSRQRILNARIGVAVTFDAQIQEVEAAVERMPEARVLHGDTCGLVPLKVEMGKLELNKQHFTVDLDSVYYSTDGSTPVYKLSTVDADRRNRFRLVVRIVFLDGCRTRPFHSPTFLLRSKKHVRFRSTSYS